MKDYTYNPKTNYNIEENDWTKCLTKFANFMLVLCFIITSVVIYFFSTYQFAQIDGDSMFPTLNGSFRNTKISDIAYYTSFKPTNKGDIVIVDYFSSGIEDSNNYEAIKRIIATGGDTIYYYAGNIFVNDKKLDEPYIENGYQFIKHNYSLEEAENWKNNGYKKSKVNFENWCKQLYENQPTTEKTEFFINYQTKYNSCITYDEVLKTYVLTLPKNFVYFLGDNRGLSKDSSLVGPVEEKYITAKVDFIVENNRDIFTHLWVKFVELF